jgi:hypothetical protein
MITKFLRSLLHSPVPNRSQSRLPSASEWQSEFLFLPNKPPLRDDTHGRAMTRRPFEPEARKTDFHGR